MTAATWAGDDPPSSEAAVAESVRLREVAEQVAGESTAYLMSVFRTPMAVEHKGGPHDLVTEHDLASERILREGLLAAEPDSIVIGEEGGSTGSEGSAGSGGSGGSVGSRGSGGSGGSGRVTWHVDPIDGTVNFSHGLPFWCVSVAAAVDGEVVAGVIAAPALGEVYAADLTGVTLNGSPAGPRRVDRELDSLVIGTFPRGVDLETNGDDALVQSGRLVRAYGAVRTLGSGALGLAQVACGRADATFDLHTNSWDVAAGSLMVRLGGGRYVGCEGGGVDEDPRTSYCRPAYWATASDVEHPTLAALVIELSTGRDPQQPADVDVDDVHS